jgi:hypothetical protein
MSAISRIVQDLIETGDYTEALAILDDLTDRGSEDFQIYRLKATVLKLLKDPTRYGDLERSLLKAHALSPGHPVTLVDLAHFYTLLKPDRAAAESFDVKFRKVVEERKSDR